MENDPILLRIDPFIWEDPNLNYPEKILVNLVLSFTLRGECCTLSDEWIASKFGWHPGFVKSVIELLSQRDLLVLSNEWGGVRNLSIFIPGKDNPCQDVFTVDGVEV